jgi:hypothetical protein
MANYYYDFHEERGEYRGYVEDANGRDVWRVTYPDFYEDEDSGDLIESSTIFDDGFMKDETDIEGLEDYLKKIGVLKHGDELKFKDDEEEDDDDEYANGGEIKWQDVQVGDSALVKSINKMGLIVHTYGRKFHLQFPDGSKKTYDASELQFYKDDEYAEGGTLNTRVINKIKAQKPFELPIELSVYVPSTEKASQIISKREYNQRIEEVQEFLAKLFGGFSSVSVEGGYVSDDKGLINEDVTRVVAFASKQGFEDKIDTLLKQIVNWCDKWGQESMGFEFEGDLFYIDAKSQFEYGGQVFFEDGGDVLMEDTVQRMDDPNFADPSYYEEGGEVDALKSKVEAILKKNLPDYFYFVKQYREPISGDTAFAIVMAVSDYEINRVRGQYPQAVSLYLNTKTLELHPQVFGGNGGQSIYRKPNMNDPKEKYLAMKNVRVPFRTPPRNEESVLKAVDNFTKNYKKTLIENKDTLMYQDLVDYNKILK